MKAFLTSALFLLASLCASAASFSVTSPDNSLVLNVETGESITYSVTRKGETVVLPSAVSMTLADGTVWGRDSRLRHSRKGTVSNVVPAELYRKTRVKDNYNSLKLQFRGDWALEFRVYDDGVAYRFSSTRKDAYNVAAEQFTVNFPSDGKVYVPYVKAEEGAPYDKQFHHSFERPYTQQNLSAMDRGHLAFLPLMASADKDAKVCISEANLEAYPGMYLVRNSEGNGLEGIFPTVPRTEVNGGHLGIERIVTEREDYIAAVEGPRSFPWRILFIGTELQIASSDLTYLLAEPSRIDDLSWIKPGKVAWDWWNDWNIAGVDFEAGINTPTYCYYIDFAAANGIEYVILDDGWADGNGGDLMKINPDIDLQHIISYAGERGVGIILWAGFDAFEKDMENVCRHYSRMGVKGFKVDFMNRDDQKMTEFNYRAAETAAKYHLVLDLHGSHKGAGINRTWPNVLNNEGVFGLENLKWGGTKISMVHYDACLPFLRAVAGPMDYTQGAMRNATKSNFRPVNSEPMSQGTRCHQLALYLIFDSPLNMLCDSPTNYIAEQQCTDFICAVPTVWDDTRMLDGKIGEYVITARKSPEAGVWYVGGITDWTPRSVDVQLGSVLEPGKYILQLFRDGANSHRRASDYKYEEVPFTVSGNNSSFTVKMAPGGGFAMKIVRL